MPPLHFGILSIRSGQEDKPPTMTLMSDRRKEYDDHARVTLDQLLLTRSGKVLALSEQPPRDYQELQSGLIDVFQTDLKPEAISENSLQRYRLGLHAGKTSVALFREIFPVILRALEENRLTVRFEDPDILVNILDHPVTNKRTGILGRLFGR